MTSRSITLPAEGWTPRAYQRDAWLAMRDPSVKTIALAWARRHGKDEVAMHATAIKAMERVGNYYHALPQYNQARKAIWEARNPHTGRIRWKGVFPEEIIKKTDNQSMMLTFINGSTWQLVGSDNIDALMGTTPAGIVFSEAAISDPTAYAFFRPILMENDGWSMHVSSTRGRNHFYELFQTLKGNPKAFTSLISARDTDVFSDADLQNERLTYVRLYGEALGNSLFEQEYFSNWDAAVVGAVWGKELSEMTERIMPMTYDPRFPVITSWDIGVADETVILFWQIVGNQVRLIDWYAATDLGLAHFAQTLRDRKYFYSMHIWPHDGKVREWGADGMSRKKQAENLGMQNIKIMPNIPKRQSIGLSSQLLKRTYINADLNYPAANPEDDCGFIYNTLKQYRYKFNPDTRVMSSEPIHDWTSHYADAVAQMAINEALHSRNGLVAPEDEVESEMLHVPSVRLRDIMSSRNPVRGAWG